MFLRRLSTGAEATVAATVAATAHLMTACQSTMKRMNVIRMLVVIVPLDPITCTNIAVYFNKQESKISKLIGIAHHILSNYGPMTSMKLQKLVYYSQAWHLVWAEKPLFTEEIQAWANGPVIPELYKTHKQEFSLPKNEYANSKSESLTKLERETIDSVAKFYNQYSGFELSEITHREEPWLKAREVMDSSEQGNNPISLELMQQYYSTLAFDVEK